MKTPAAADGADESRIREEFAVFEELIGVAEGLFHASRVREAAACAGIAAASAWRNHAGLFASPRLERLLNDLGRRAVRVPPAAAARERRASPASVLHVMSKARDVGGDSRLACRWMHADATRRHSVAVTSQAGQPIAQEFIEATARAGGQVHCLDADTGNPILRARRLRALAAEADAVVLHLYPDDIVPPLAFACRDGLPPIVFIHHSDHTFWVGVNLGDVVVQLRQSGVGLTLHRRRIEPERLTMLPIPLSPAIRTLSRAEAKRQLGIRPEQVVLLSVGTEFKYAPVAGPGFLEVLLPVVKAHGEVVVLVVGPHHRGEWAAAHDSTQGRVAALGRRHDTALLFQAADIYVDPIPCTSPTAALEAGSYALPIISYSTHAGDAEVFSPGAPGLDESVWRSDTVPAFAEALSRLIVDAACRREWGARAQQSIERHHLGPQWVDRLPAIYGMAAASAALAAGGVAPAADQCRVDRVDVLINRLYRVDPDGLGRIIDEHVRSLPLTGRIAVLRRLLAVNRSFSFDLFLPAALARGLTMRPPYWGAIRRWLSRPHVAVRRDRCASA